MYWIQPCGLPISLVSPRSLPHLTSACFLFSLCSLPHLLLSRTSTAETVLSNRASSSKELSLISYNHGDPPGPSLILVAHPAVCLAYIKPPLLESGNHILLVQIPLNIQQGLYSADKLDSEHPGLFSANRRLLSLTPGLSTFLGLRSFNTVTCAVVTFNQNIIFTVFFILNFAIAVNCNVDI